MYRVLLMKVTSFLLVIDAVSFYTGASDFVHKMNKLCSIRFLLLLASFTGLLNLIYLMVFADLKGNLELYTLSSSSVLRRQIASIQVDSEARVYAGPSLSYLELLNLDLKDVVQRYVSSSETVAKHYEAASLQENNLSEQHKLAHTPVPNCPPSLFLLIMVHSSPANLMDRESIRLSWGREDNPINQGSWTNSDR